MDPWLEPAVWQSVADELAGHRQAGLGRLLTEDVVRFATARALVGHGCDPATLRAECPHPALPGSRIDLVLGTPAQVSVELKYPREPSGTNAPWTMLLGQVLKDLYRLSAVPLGDRVFVAVQTARLEGFLSRSAARYGLHLAGDQLVVEPAAARALPLTAIQAIGPELLTRRVTATRLLRAAAGDQLSVSVYLVDPGPAGHEAAPLHAPAPEQEPNVTHDVDPEDSIPAGLTSPLEPGVRGEIHRAVRAILSRSGQSTFTLDEVVREMRGSRYAESTVRTMICSHLCANAPDHAAVTYDDFERVGRGLYRPTSTWWPRPSQKSSRCPTDPNG